MANQRETPFWVIQVDHLDDILNYDFNATIRLIDSERLKLVNPIDLIICLCYSCLFVSGLISNLWVVGVISAVLCRRRGGRFINILIFILCLALLNIAITFSMPIAIADIITGYWPLPTLICPLYWILEMLNKSMSSMLIAFLTICCYFAVCRPQMKKMYKNWISATTQICLAFGLIAWKMYAIFSHYDVYYIVQANINNTLIRHGKKCLFQTADNENTQISFTFFSFAVGYVLPVTIMALCYFCILRQVYFVRQRENGDHSEISNTNCQVIRSRRFIRTVKSVAKLVVFYLITWTPYWCLNIQLHILPSTDYKNKNAALAMVTALISHLMPFVNTAFAPLIYTLSNKQIRHLYKNSKKKRINRSIREE